jgi:uncharacterized protein (DUF1697 family)
MAQNDWHTISFHCLVVWLAGSNTSEPIDYSASSADGRLCIIAPQLLHGLLPEECMEPSTTQRWIALLRAINVGGHTIKMDVLRGHFEAMGYRDVETMIASGNVIFRSSITDRHALEPQIEQYLKQALGYEVATFLRTPAEINRIAAFQPFPDQASDETAALYIGFLPAAPDQAACDRLALLENAIDRFRVDQQELYWMCRTKVSESPNAGNTIEKALKLATTLRNSTTVRKLAAKYPA